MVSDLTGGWTNSHLTETGKAQAEAVALWLSEELPSRRGRILCSDLSRAVQTAKPIAEALGVDFTRHKEMRELNNGIAAGKTKQEVKPFLNVSPVISVDWHPYPGSESWREFYARVSKFMDEMYPTFDETTVIVCYGGTIQMITSWWLGLEPEHMNRVFFESAPTGVTILHIAFWENRTIERLNDTYHLTRNGSRNPFPKKEA